MKKVVLFYVAKNLMYHSRCSRCLNIQMFPCCPKMLSRDADLLVLRQLLVSLRKPSLNEEFLLFLVFSICPLRSIAASLPSPRFPWRPAQSYEHSIVCSQCFLFLAVFSTTCPSLQASFGELEGFL